MSLSTQPQECVYIALLKCICIVLLFFSTVDNAAGVITVYSTLLMCLGESMHDAQVGLVHAVWDKGWDHRE